MPRVSIVWLDREGKVRCRATRADEKSAREFARQLTADGHSDVRYKLPGASGWKAVRVKRTQPVRRKSETPFPPDAKTMKERHHPGKPRSDALGPSSPRLVRVGESKVTTHLCQSGVLRAFRGTEGPNLR
jgi:hypothetical protein